MRKLSLVGWTLTSTLAIAACSTLPARERGFDPSLCNRHGAYEAGMADGEENRQMNSGFAYGCREDLRAGAYEGYREGYDKGRARWDAQVKQWQANQADEPAPTATPGVLPVSNNTNIQINIGGSGDRAIGGAGAAPRVNPRAWFCEVKAFMAKFEAFGPTELEARHGVSQACQKQYHAMHCDEITCRQNR